MSASPLVCVCGVLAFFREPLSAIKQDNVIADIKTPDSINRISNGYGLPLKFVI